MSGSTKKKNTRELHGSVLTTYVHIGNSYIFSKNISEVKFLY